MLLTLTPMNIFAADADKTAFSDMKETDYYAQAATALEQLDILAGYPDGTFGAEKSITRAEMAAIVCRMIDIQTVVDGKYYFYIHNYSGEGSFGTSAAQVEVYKGDEIIATYNAPLNQGSGLYWNVFVLDTVAETITPVNSVTNSPSTGSVSLYSTEDGLTNDEILSLIAEDIEKSAKE